MTGCQATVRVGMAMGADGRGAVTVDVALDGDAARQVPALAQELRTADLTRAGWVVSGPTATADHGVRVTLRKPFTGAAQATAVLGELSGQGPGGVQAFRDLRVARRSSFLQTTTTFHGVVDLSCGLSCFSDARLHQLGADALDPARLRQLTGGDPAQALRVTFHVDLPGTVREWQVPPGGRVTMDATSGRPNTRRRALTIVAVAAGAAALVVFAAGWLWGGRRRRRRAEAAVGVPGEAP